MKVLQIGYGKMGQFICRALKNNNMVTELVVSDLKVQQPYEQDGIRFVGNIKESEISEFDCAFISSFATSHCQVAEMLLNAGLKKIYIEKPAVMNQEEYNRILEKIGDCKIVTGYILRQSEPMFAMKCIIDKMLDSIFENDPERADRVIYAQLSYYLRFDHFNALLRLTSSFKSEERKREFFFTYKDGNGNRRHIYLSFDNADGLDWLIVTEANGHILYKEEYPSLLKLDHQVAEILKYFETGEQYNLSLFEDSLTVLALLKEAGVYC